MTWITGQVRSPVSSRKSSILTLGLVAVGEEVQKQEQVKLALAPVYARPLSTRTRKPRRRSDANGQLYYPDPDVKRSHKKKVIVEERVVEIEVDDDDGWEAEYCIDAFHYGNVSPVNSLHLALQY